MPCLLALTKKGLFTAEPLTLLSLPEVSAAYQQGLCSGARLPPAFYIGLGQRKAQVHHELLFNHDSLFLSFLFLGARGAATACLPACLSTCFHSCMCSCLSTWWRSHTCTDKHYHVIVHQPPHHPISAAGRWESPDCYCLQIWLFQTDN